MTVGIFLQALAFAVLSGIVASNKNRSVVGWGMLGFLFSFFGFLAAIAVSEVEEEEPLSHGRESQLSGSGGFDPDQHVKKCPDCAEYIKIEARVCKHCGHEFSEEEVNNEIRKRLEEEIDVEKTDSEEAEKVQDGVYYCEQDEITVMPTRDKITCPACGGWLSDTHHTYIEEEERDEEEEQE